MDKAINHSTDRRSFIKGASIITAAFERWHELWTAKYPGGHPRRRQQGAVETV
jgi:hypothetical protein